MADTIVCDECGNEKPNNPIESWGFMTVHYDPWDEGGKTVHFCSEECYNRLFDQSWANFRYFTCDRCERVINRQCPTNGWHGYTRVVDDEEVCLKCYEESILENGIPKDSFVEGKIAGMFFSGDNHEPLKAGYKLILDNRFVNSQKSVDDFCRNAIDLIDAGYKVVVGYESMGIGGSEGYVSLFAKDTA